ncbi:MAG: non-heme iron oxygenase ferredoxin subunit [Candidatus Omnitrophica bacterium]|nr:non-heme iron oxygenase ferredoxin subunit [Candidatus Omnitrophota bacterium]
MDADGFFAVATLTDVPVGGIKCIEVQGTPVALCNVEGRIFAVGNVCTHDAGPLSGGTLEDYALECPRHGARFDVRSGKVLCLPAAVPIPTYEVKVEGDEVKVKVG